MFLIAFIGGFLTIAAPCILAVLPILLGTTLGQQNKLRPLMIVLGLTASFTGFGVLFASVTSFFGLSNNTLRLSALILLGLFGLALIFPSTYEKILFTIQNFFKNLFPKKEAKTSASFKPAEQKKGLWSGFVIGASLGLVWVPCAGPILGAILTLAVTQKDLGSVALLLLAYSAGAGLPMLVIAYGGNWIISKLGFLKKNSQRIQQVSGAVLLIGVIFIWTGLDIKISTQLAVLFPNFNQVEENLLNQTDSKSTATSTSSSSSKIPIIILKPEIKAPEIIGTQAWINSEPLTLAQLKGKVVIIDFWTYSCINCIRTLPHLKDWYSKYKDKGFVIIGIHAPEFAFEKELANVQKAVKDFGLEYPIVQDNDFATWKAYNNRFWPAKYVIDKNGFIRYTHFGEGLYDQTEEVIQMLLAEESNQSFSIPMLIEMGSNKNQKNEQANATVDFKQIETSETYLGYERSESQNNSEAVLPDATQTFAEPALIEENKFSLVGEWMVKKEYITPTKTPAKLILNYKASKVNLVIASGEIMKELHPSADESQTLASIPTPIAKIYLDGKLISPNQKGSDVNEDGIVSFPKDALYNLVDTGNSYERHILTIEFLTPGVNAYAFTFG